MIRLILPRRLREGRQLVSPRRQRGFIINPYVFTVASGPAPVVQTRGTSTEAFASTHVVTLPSGVTVGDLIVVAMISSANGTHSVSAGTGWTKLDQEAFGVSSMTLSIFAKIATGTDSLTIALGSTGWNRTISWRISGVASLASIIWGKGSASTTTPDLPNVSGASADRLWLAILGIFGTASTSAYPSNCPNGQRTATGAAANRMGYASAEATVNAASFDPNTFTISASSQVQFFNMGIAA